MRLGCPTAAPPFRPPPDVGRRCCPTWAMGSRSAKVGDLCAEGGDEVARHAFS